jgi:hypothetical protein
MCPFQYALRSDHVAQHGDDPTLKVSGQHPWLKYIAMRKAIQLMQERGFLTGIAFCITFYFVGEEFHAFFL